ncbi:unnamed protein product [Brassicogethes aeneus]|uniref:Uncharacterized protein n=1 Tax=Brassicogethes aeneus TaxID=1431903 RepID=A0A9P0FKX0_BRAAE|nr:unnamed protein product [Brassicogethes aeneus]
MDLNPDDVPVKKPKKVRNSVIIRDKKVKGLEHVNHKGRLIPAKSLGEDCRCARFKCFTVLSEQERQNVLTEFYKIQSKNLQDSHLCGLIRVDPIKQRRSRKSNRRSLVQYSDSSEEEYARPNDYAHAAAYRYKIRTKQIDNNNYYKEIPVCKRAFLSLHGITSARLRRLQSSLSENLKSPTDRRGQHKNRPNALPEEIVNFREKIRRGII